MRKKTQGKGSGRTVQNLRKKLKEFAKEYSFELGIIMKMVNNLNLEDVASWQHHFTSLFDIIRILIRLLLVMALQFS